MENLIQNLNHTISNPPANVLFLDAKKRGRPKKEGENFAPAFPAKHKLHDEKSDASAKVGMKGDDSIVASALKKKRNKKLTAEIKALNTNIKEDFADLINWEQKYQYAPGTIESPDWVPAYKFCKIYSCYWCQEFSWDLKRCSNCKRHVPPKVEFLTIETSETFDSAVDKSRPFFHPPPVPYFKKGKVVFCTSCFSLTCNFQICDVCGYKVAAPAEQFKVDFCDKQCEELSANDSLMIMDFVPRKIGSTLIECPHCYQSSKSECSACVHCGENLPTKVLISSTSNADKLFEMVWPLKNEILAGVIKTPPSKYVPVFKENMLTTCTWCSTLVFDLLRCSSCFRQLPKIKNLVTLQANSMYGISYGPTKPVYDPLPVPHYQPGKMSVCHECKNYSRNLRQCDYCGEKQRNYVAVYVNFKNIKLTTKSDKETLVAFKPRMVNKQYYVCPRCELTTDKIKCIHCSLRIPSTVKVVELSRSVARKGRNLQGKIILGHFKKYSLSREDPLINSGSITKRQIEEGAEKLPENYVPRYREKGIVQCNYCFHWSWDFHRCSNCCNKIDIAAALVLFPKPNFSHSAFEETRPKLHSPTPYFKLGLMTLCPGCLCFVSGPPECPECNHRIENNCTYFYIKAKEVDVSDLSMNRVKFHPRTLSDKSMAFCLFCGFSSEDFKTCSVCAKSFPKYCTVTPADGSSTLPPELNFAQPMQAKITAEAIKAKPTLQVEKAMVTDATDESEAVEAELIRINDWKAAVGFQENNETQKWMNSIPFAVKLDVLYDHQLTCFPDEIFELSKGKK